MENLPESPARGFVAALLIGATAACGPSLVDPCRSACRHIYQDCFTGNACSKCVKYPEDTVAEAACEADCETRPSICRDAGALYSCLAGVDCSPPMTEFLTTCYSAGECVSLTGSSNGPAVSIANWTEAGIEVDGTQEQSPGGTIEIDWFDAGGRSPFCQGDLNGMPAALLSVLGAGGSPLTVPGTFTANTNDAGCSGDCEVCPADGGACASILIGEGQYWQPTLVSGTIDLLEVNSLHVAGNFAASQILPDGGVVVLEGTFDAPQGCLYTPAFPDCTWSHPCGCSTAGSQLGALWIVGLFVLARRRALSSTLTATRGSFGSRCCRARVPPESATIGPGSSVCLAVSVGRNAEHDGIGDAGNAKMVPALPRAKV